MSGCRACGRSTVEPLVDLGSDRTAQVRHPVRYSSTPAAVATPPPGIGEHDALVTAWLADPDATLPRRT